MSWSSRLKEALSNKDLTSPSNTFPELIAPGAHAATGKTTPVDADELPIVDSAASNVLKKVTFANLKAWFKSYYDTVTSTMTNKTLTDPKVNSIIDTNGAAMIGFAPAASSVNFFQMQNGAAGNAVWLQAVGADTDIPLVLNPKGSGPIYGWANSAAQMSLIAVGGTNCGWNMVTQGTGRVQENGNTFASFVAAPATATSAGKQYQVAFDSTHFYVCIATNSWIRATFASW